MKHSITPLKNQRCQDGQPGSKDYSETVIMLICGLPVTKQKFKTDLEHKVGFVAIDNNVVSLF